MPTEHRDRFKYYVSIIKNVYLHSIADSPGDLIQEEVITLFENSAQAIKSKGGLKPMMSGEVIKGDRRLTWKDEAKTAAIFFLQSHKRRRSRFLIWEEIQVKHDKTSFDQIHSSCGFR